MEYSKFIKNYMFTLRILFAAFAAQPLMLAFVLMQKHPSKGFDMAAFQNSQHMIFAIVSVVAFILGLVAPKLLLSPQRARTALQKPWTKEVFQSMTNKGQRIYSDEDIQQILNLPPHEQPLMKTKDAFFLSTLVSFVLFEMSTLMGFMIAFTSENASMFAPFVVPTYLGLAFTFPTLNKLKEFADSGK